MDIGYDLDKFTFSNRRKGIMETKARLDRFVANSAWRHYFPWAKVFHGFANTSDHIPIVLSLSETPHWKSNVRKPNFRFEPMRSRDASFHKELDNIWIETRSCSIPLRNKLQLCADSLLCWNKKVFGNVQQRIQTLKSEIQDLRNMPRSDSTVQKEESISKRLDE